MTIQFLANYMSVAKCYIYADNWSTLDCHPCSEVPIYISIRICCSGASGILVLGLLFTVISIISQISLS